MPWVDLSERNWDNRNPEYWEALRDFVQQRVEKFSSDLEELAKWTGPKPWIAFHFNPTPDLIQARIVRNELQAQVWFSLGILRWLDQVSQWLLTGEPIRAKLRLFANRGEEDYSKWVVTRWLDWVMMHEFGHFFCGHLSGRVMEWTEGKQTAAQDPALTQAMEFDADMFAARMYFTALHGHFEKRIYQDFYRTEDVDEFFWDMGLLFGGLFFALEELNPTGKTKTHPKANERMMAFVVSGMGAYERAAKCDVSSPWKWLLNGIFNVLWSAGAEETEFGKTMGSISNVIEPRRQLLLKVGMEKRRLFKFEDDWLLKQPTVA